MTADARSMPLYFLSGLLLYYRPVAMASPIYEYLAPSGHRRHQRRRRRRRQRGHMPPSSCLSLPFSMPILLLAHQAYYISLAPPPSPRPPLPPPIFHNHYFSIRRRRRRPRTSFASLYLYAFVQYACISGAAIIIFIFISPRPAYVIGFYRLSRLASYFIYDIEKAPVIRPRRRSQ